jgi:hypothetical protein
MDFYIDFVTTYPFTSAITQFAVLGTLGEILATKLAGKKGFLTLYFVLSKALVWGILAVPIKIAFIGFEGFVAALVLNGLLPESVMEGFAFALTRSISMNLQFGPFLVLIHRALDNLVTRENNWKNIDKAFYSLLWFWIPAHTLTFSLPVEFQIGMAALWSFMLGLILAYFSRKKEGVEA